MFFQQSSNTSSNHCSIQVITHPPTPGNICYHCIQLFTCEIKHNRITRPLNMCGQPLYVCNKLHTIHAAGWNRRTTALSATAKEFFKSCITFDPIPTMQNNKIIKLVLYAGNGGQYDSLVDAISCCCRLAPSHKHSIT